MGAEDTKNFRTFAPIMVQTASPIQQLQQQQLLLQLEYQTEKEAFRSTGTVPVSTNDVFTMRSPVWLLPRQ